MMMTTSASPAILHLTHFQSCHLESSECYIPGCSARKAWHAVRLFEEKNKLALVKYFLLGRPPAPLIQSSESSTLENGRPLFVHRSIISCKIIKQSIFKTSRSFFFIFSPCRLWFAFCRSLLFSRFEFSYCGSADHQTISWSRQHLRKQNRVC